MTLGALLESGPPERKQALRARCDVLLTALGAAAGVGWDAVLSGSAERVWCALAVLGARLPTDAEVLQTVRAVQLNGAAAGLVPVLEGVGEQGPYDDVHLLEAQTLVLQPSTALGRALVREWLPADGALIVEWDARGDALRPVGGGAVLVPWRSRLVLAEPVVDVRRSEALLALLRRSGCRGVAVLPGCGQLVAPGLPSVEIDGIVAGLAAVAHTDRIATTSQSGADELRGWRQMLSGTGVSGPDIEVFPVALPLQPVPATAIAADLPLVVCTAGLARGGDTVLLAAQELWDEGLHFRLAVPEEPASVPHPHVTALGPDALRAALSGARLSLFPALGDELSASVADSLWVGVPVITAPYGTMREVVGDGGGAVLVDPRDESAVVAALRSLLIDDELHATLAAQASSRDVQEVRDWALAVWAYLVTDA